MGHQNTPYLLTEKGHAALAAPLVAEPAYDADCITRAARVLESAGRNGYAEAVRNLAAITDHLAAERDRFKQDSITLNSVGWKLAEALGDVPPGADRIEGSPIEQADRLIAELSDARQQLAAGLQAVGRMAGPRPTALQLAADVLAPPADDKPTPMPTPGGPTAPSPKVSAATRCSCYRRQPVAVVTSRSAINPACLVHGTLVVPVVDAPAGPRVHDLTDGRYRWTCSDCQEKGDRHPFRSLAEEGLARHLAVYHGEAAPAFADGTGA